MMQYVYITDGSEDGLLSAVYRAWYQPQEQVYDILWQAPAQTDLTLQPLSVPSDPEHARRVRTAIERKISPTALDHVLLGWYSQQPQCGRQILHYLRLGFRVGSKIDEMVTHDSVLPLLRNARRVQCEAHRMLGLIRFKLEVHNLFIARIDTDHWVLPLIAEHFAARMGGCRFIIYDRKRAQSLISDNGQWRIVALRLDEELPLAREEAAFQALWQRYYKHIAIPERTNPRQQRQCMPQRYWHNLVEQPRQ